jgi:hypothetical protein
MPNIDFERKALAARLAKTMHAPNFTSRLLGIKTKLDYEDEELIRLNFLDTFRPELWCLEGLARHLEPVPGRHYGLELVEKLPRVAVQFAKVPQGKQTWILYVEVQKQQEIVDDGYFLKKVREQIGFGNYQNIDVTVMPGMQQNIAVTIAEDDSGETVPSMVLETGINTVVITTRDLRAGAWLLFTLLCNYLDRGYKPLGYAASIDEKDEKAIVSQWNPFAVSQQYIVHTLGFAPSPERFRAVLQDQHYALHHDGASGTWHISPPIFRFDILHPIDILEDYLVSTGYEEVSGENAKIAPALQPTGSQTRRNALEERLVDYMQVYGARQTIGLLMDSYENVVERMYHDAPERLIHLVNAANRNREYAVDSSLPPLLRNAVHPSAPLPPTVFYLFTKTLFLDEKKIAHSRWEMGILLLGTDHPFNNAHTLLDALCYHLRLQYTLKRGDYRALIPGRQMNVLAADRVIGQFGEVHPEVLTRWDLFYPTSFIELDLDSITELWDGMKVR